MLKGPAADLERIGDIGDIDVRLLVQAADQVIRDLFERGPSSGRKRNQAPGRLDARRLARRRLLQHHMRIGAADSERADPGSARMRAGPLRKFRLNAKGAVLKIDLWV